jgi:hypothetical protein
MPHPHWTAYLTALALPAIALIAAWIAFRQSQIARNKLKLDLFEKRMTVYQAVCDALSVAAARGKLTHEEEVKYFVGTRAAQWLFGPGVFRYLNETLWHKILDLGLHNTMSEGLGDDEERIKHLRARTDTMKWLAAQHKEFDKLCADYLSLKH